MSEESSLPYSLNQISELTTGTVLLVDKPQNWTSFDVVNKIKWELRRILKLKKFKVGHAGTLDPLATGLLVICTGKLTRSIEQLQAGEKEYSGTFFLGKTTASFDLESEPEGNFSIEHITLELLRQTAQQMTGSLEQRPPVFSAKRINGRRAYLSAREGVHVEIPIQTVQIHTFEITRFEGNEVDFLIRCSKGTYIRSMADDFGRNLNSGAYLKSLRRTESAPFRLESAMQLSDLMSELSDLRPENTIQPTTDQLDAK